MKQAGFLWNWSVVVVVDKLSTEKNCTYMESNRLTQHAQSLLGGVKRENPRGKGKLGNEKIYQQLN